MSFTVEGNGPLVIAVPGMGDLRSSYCELVRPLVSAGYRVAVTDLRAHGQGDVTFSTFGDVATGGDVIALIEELGGPAVVLGNSMGAGAAAWAAAERPDLVAGLVYYGPFLRDANTRRFTAAATHAFYRLAFSGAWGAGLWAGYYRKTLNRGRAAPWLPEHAAAIKANLKEPGRLRSFRHLALQLTHAPVEARLGEVSAPTLAFMGALDPDFPRPEAELEWIASLGARTGLVDDAAHYPHAQRPDVVVPATLSFLAGLRGSDAPVATSWAASRG